MCFPNRYFSEYKCSQAKSVEFAEIWTLDNIIHKYKKFEVIDIWFQFVMNCKLRQIFAKRNLFLEKACCNLHIILGAGHEQFLIFLWCWVANVMAAKYFCTKLIFHAIFIEKNVTKHGIVFWFCKSGKFLATLKNYLRGRSKTIIVIK